MLDAHHPRRRVACGFSAQLFHFCRGPTGSAISRRFSHVFHLAVSQVTVDVTARLVESHGVISHPPSPRRFHSGAESFARPGPISFIPDSFSMLESSAPPLDEAICVAPLRWVA